MSVSQDSKNLGVINWLGTFFFGFIPPTILYFVKSEDRYVRNQAVEALNWCITLALANVVAAILSLVVVGTLLFPIIGLCHFLFCALGVFATMKGDDFQVPLTLRLLR